MLAEEVLIYRIVLNDIVGDVVQDHQVRLRRKDDAVIRQLEATMLVGRKHRHGDVLVRETTVSDARPEDRVHLRHVSAPQHKRVSLLDVVIAAHRLIHTKGTHKANYCRRHTVTRVRVDVVRTEARFEQLGRGITFPDSPLTRTEHTDRFRPFFFQGGFEFLFHHIEGLIPGDWGKFAFFVIFTVFHTQQRLRQTVFTVHDFGQEIALNAVQATVNRCVRVALTGHHTPLLRSDQNAATSTAETARRFIPFNGFLLTNNGAGNARHAETGSRRSGRNGVSFHKATTTEFHGVSSPCSSCW